jgi:hypothetical protein
MEKFTIEEIKNYLKSQDSFGDAVYYLTAENIRKANSVSQTCGDLIQSIVNDAESDHYTPQELLDEWQSYLDLEWSSNGIESIKGEIIMRYYPKGNPFYESADGDSIATHELTFKNGQLHSVEEIEE